MAREIEKPLLHELEKLQRRYDDAKTEADIAKEKYDGAQSRLNKARHDRDSTAKAIIALRGGEPEGLPIDPVITEAIEFVKKDRPVA